MSVRRDTIRYGAAAAVLALAIIAGSAFLVNSSLLPWSSSNSNQSPNSLLVIQVTDPPSFPLGTTSLNLTYSALALLVGEPSGTSHQMNTSTVAITSSGSSATVDLLKLQNISQTIGSASLPKGSLIYSVTFTVYKISADINGTIYPVSLASGGNGITVTMSNQPELHGTNVALLQLNPVVVDTPSGFSLIPSSVGVLQQSEGQGESQVGWQHQLTNEDIQDLDYANGAGRLGPV